jgi:DNA repair ATPase RecN
LVLEKKLETI